MKKIGISILKSIVFVVFSVAFRVKIEGRENIPKAGAAVLCANHNSELGMFFIGYRIKRLVRWMAKEELFKNPIFAAFIKSLGAFPIKRGKSDIDAMKALFKLLDEGHIIGMFPEGTRVKDRTKKDVKAKPGAAMIAVKKGVPIIPVGVEGGNKVFRRVRIVFGEPYYIKTEPGKKYTTVEYTDMSNEIMEKVYGLLGEK